VVGLLSCDVVSASSVFNQHFHIAGGMVKRLIGAFCEDIQSKMAR